MVLQTGDVSGEGIVYFHRGWITSLRAPSVLITTGLSRQYQSQRIFSSRHRRATVSEEIFTFNVVPTGNSGALFSWTGYVSNFVRKVRPCDALMCRVDTSISSPKRNAAN